MRKLFALALLASLSWTLVGCGESAPAPTADDHGPQAPGVPTEGPEALKTKKK